MAETGRPSAMQSQPVFMDPVFDDPDDAMRQIRDAGPFQALLAYHGGTVDSAYDMPMFRHAMTSDAFLHNPNWIEAAKRSFGAGIVEPARCLLNLYAPTEELSAHTDLPTYRGFTPSAETRHLLMAMINSQLFFDWMVPFASGLAWFWRGEGGAFLYWADGKDAPPQVLRPPFWNCGLMSDNEAMFHAVSAVGSAAERARYTAMIKRSDTMHAVGEADWEITGETHPPARLGPDEVRISLLWRARVFRDEAHRDSFEDSAWDLTPERIAEVFVADLAQRGERFEEPSDPLDEAWQEFLAEAYPPQFTPATADFLG